MANHAAISAAARSLERFLNHAFQSLEPVPLKETRAVLIRTNDFESSKENLLTSLPKLSIFLYRIDFNKTMRASWSGIGHAQGQSHLALDLHFLLTAWADNAEHELLILGRTMQAIETTPTLSGPLLHPEGQWSTTESVQFLLEEISTEAVMRIFDSLRTGYRLSVPYLARVVRLDGVQARPTPPATTVESWTAPNVSP